MHLRKPKTAKEELAVTQRYFAKNETAESLMFQF